MQQLDQLPQWRALLKHRDALASQHLNDLFAADPQRFDNLSLRMGAHPGAHLSNLLLDFSKQRVTSETIGLLLQFAEARDLRGGMQRMAAGEAINFTERRAALHIALRVPHANSQSNSQPYFVNGENVLPLVQTVRERMRRFSESIRNGALRGARGKPIRHVINLGIGGSDLGPRMATHALGAFAHEAIKVDFVANIDPTELAGTLRNAVPDETLFIISSKTFSTVETFTNAQAAKTWLATALGNQEAVGAHFAAVTNNIEAATRFGIAADHCFPLQEWVGGRYSLWSAIGLPLAIAIGMDNFEEMLAGAHEVDTHFFTTPFERNLPLMMALLGIWNVNFLGAQTCAVLPYAHALSDLPAYLQQLEMESNGKRVNAAGETVGYGTAAVVWGGAGSAGQHTFHQLLYQGTHLIPADFIVVVGDTTARQQTLVANAIAQSAALMRGKTTEAAQRELLARGVDAAEAQRLAPHLACPGNQPSSTLLMPQLTPHSLGSLLALYEHKVFVQGWLWGINSFDQYGVELGKQIATEIARGGNMEALDSSTRGLLAAVNLRRAQ